MASQVSLSLSLSLSLSPIAVCTLLILGSMSPTIAQVPSAPESFAVPCPQVLADYENLLECEVHVIPSMTLSSWLSTAKVSGRLTFDFFGNQPSVDLHSANEAFTQEALASAPNVFPFQGNVTMPGNNSWIPGADTALTFDMDNNVLTGVIRIDDNLSFIVQPMAPLPSAILAQLPATLQAMLLQKQPELVFKDGDQYGYGIAEGDGSPAPPLLPPLDGSLLSTTATSTSTQNAGCFAPVCWQNYAAFVHAYVLRPSSTEHGAMYGWLHTKSLVSTEGLWAS